MSLDNTPSDEATSAVLDTMQISAYIRTHHAKMLEVLGKGAWVLMFTKKEDLANAPQRTPVYFPIDAIPMIANDINLYRSTLEVSNNVAVICVRCDILKIGTNANGSIDVASGQSFVYRTFSL